MSDTKVLIECGGYKTYSQVGQGRSVALLIDKNIILEVIPLSNQSTWNISFSVPNQQQG